MSKLLKEIKNLITNLLSENYEVEKVETKFFLPIKINKDKFEFEDFLYHYILKNDLEEYELTTHYHAGLILNILIGRIKNERSFISDNSLNNAIIKASGLANLYYRRENKEYKSANTFYRGSLRTYQLFSLFPNAKFYISKAYELKLTVNKLVKISDVDFNKLIEPINKKYTENKIKECLILEKLINNDLVVRINSHINNRSLKIYGEEKYSGIAHERYKTVREV